MSSADNYERAAARLAAGVSGTARPFEYEDAMVFLAELRVPPEQVRSGSIPEDSVRFVADAAIRATPDGIAPRGLHVGNYVGVSLVSLAAATVRHHPGALVVGVDANLPHRGTFHTQDIVCKLIDRYGLDRSIVLICGYSGAKAPSNNGWVIDGYDPAEQVVHEAAPADVIANLARLGADPFDWVLVDGNHHPDYLQRDLEALAPLVRVGGVVCLDDCSDAWPEVRAVFEAQGAVNATWCSRGTDGRIGILERCTP